jgi:hypothetical protein
MSRTKRIRVPLPTEEEMNVALSKKREVVAIAAKNRERWLFLKLAFRTGDIATICVEPYQADYLFRVLRDFLPNRGENDGSPLHWASEGLERQEGQMVVDDDSPLIS